MAVPPLRHATPRLALVTVLAASALPAHAAAGDFETWVWFETRLPLARGGPSFPRTTWRAFTDVRFNERSGGLAQIFARTGPLFHVLPWMFVGVHGVIYADRLASSAFAQEARAELEPNLFGRLGDFTFNDRNRLEFRWRDNGVRWRYRNQLRVSYQPVGARWIPFVWDEVLVDLSGLGVNQNRATLGIGHVLYDRSRIEVGYMLRSREEPTGWVHDHLVNLYLFTDFAP